MQLYSALLRIFKLVSVETNLEGGAVMKWTPIFYQERTFFISMWITLTINSLGITYPPGVQMRANKDMYHSQYYYQEPQGKRLFYPKMLKNYNVVNQAFPCSKWVTPNFELHNIHQINKQIPSFKLQVQFSQIYDDAMKSVFAASIVSWLPSTRKNICRYTRHQESSEWYQS